MSFVLLDSQKVALSVQPVDAAGNPAPVDGAPSWETGGAHPEILQLAPAADGLSCEIVAAGGLGTAQVKVSADARLGADIKTITGILDVEVVAGEAVTLTINAGSPEEKDSPPPAAA